MEQAVAARITGFVATMRANGFTVGISETVDALRVADAMGVMQHESLRWGWRGLLCACADDWHRFDALFDSFWLPPNSRKLVESRTSGGGRVELDPAGAAAKGQAGPALQQAADGEAANAGDSTSKEGASAAAALEEANFQSLTDPEQTRAIEVLIRRFVRR